MQLAAAEMACGAGMKMEKPKTEVKSVEGKCGDMMDGDKMKKAWNRHAAPMMKGKEGSCGELHGTMADMLHEK